MQSYIKGAPERVLSKCTHFLQGGTIWKITDEFRGLYDEAYSVRPLLRAMQDDFINNCYTQYMASRGHRVIGCAQLLLPGDEYPKDFAWARNGDNCPTEGYVFVGLVSLEDPPKHGVRLGHFSFRLQIGAV